MGVDAGALDTPVYLSKTVEIEDDMGGGRGGAGEETMRWASVMPANWRQQQMAMQRQQRVDLVVTIRYEAAFAAFGEGRARFVDRAGRERFLWVKTCVDPDNMGDMLELHCIEGGPR